MEPALKLLRILLRYKAKPGTTIATLEAMDWWLDVEGSDAETFFFGLAQATIEGWIISARGEIQLTTAGITVVDRATQ